MTALEARQLDTAKVDAMAERLVDMLNAGALTLMISLGHRSHLFDVLATLPPSTSTQIAAVAQLHERYVREWLNAMVVGGIVEYDPNAKAYWLPPEHAALLTEAAAPNNLAPFAQYIPVMAAVEDDILQCFQQGGGVPYSRYGRFHAVMAEDSNQTIVSALEDHILPLVPGLCERLEAGIDVLDVGCGQGKALLKLAAHFPNSRFRGYDISAETFAIANEQAASLPNLTFHVQDTTRWDEPAAYDLITTFDAVHDQARPDWLLCNIYTALRPGGIYLMQDIHASSDVSGNLDHPVAPLLYTISCMHCTSVSLAAGGLGLGTMWGQEKACELLQAAGFADIAVHQLEHDIMNDYYIMRKAA